MGAQVRPGLRQSDPPSAAHGRRLSAHDQINNLFLLRRDHVPADQYRAARAQAFQSWAEVTGVAALA